MQALPFLLLLAGGFVGGFFGAAVGSAGLVSLPILLFLGFSPHAAIAATRPAAVILEGICAVRYWREGKISRRDLRRSIVLVFFGAAGGIIGAFVVSGVADQTLRLLLALVLASMVVFLFFRGNWGLQERPQRQRYLTLLAICTMLTGIYGGFFGFTFGTLMTVVLVMFGYTLLQGAAQSRIIGTLTSVATAIVFSLQGSVSWPHAAALAVGFALGGWMGAGVSAKQGSWYVRTLLLAVVGISVGKLLLDYLWA